MRHSQDGETGVETLKEIDPANLKFLTFPKDPSVLKIVRRANSLRREKNATARAKCYGECSEVLAFLGERGRRTAQMVKNYGGSKILWIRVPYYF